VFGECVDIVQAADATGTLHQRGRSRAVRVQVAPLHEDTTKSVWRELILMQQLTESLGDKVVRVVGYVENPGRSVHVILEEYSGSVLNLMDRGRMNVQDAVRTP
jgi:hypothetical protein